MSKINEVDSKVERLKKDINVVEEWRKSGKPFTKEQNFFAEQLVDRMLAMKMVNKMGVQLISADNVAFLKKYEASARTQDVVGSTVEKPKPLRVSQGLKDVAVEVKPKPTEVRQSPDAQNIKQKGPANQADGEVTSVATDKVPAKELTSDADTKDVTVENIGHNPQLPMPTKMAEELIGNVKWGIKVGAYRNEDEGITAQLTRKSYSEFVNTPEKYETVKNYLQEISAKATDPKKI